MAKLLRVAVDGLRPGTAELEESPSRYVTRVHRLTDGDRFLAFDPVARVEGEATIVLVRPKSLRYEVADLRPAPPSFTDEIRLLISAGKGDKVDEVIRDATALGVSSVTVLISERSVSEPKARAAERWRKIGVDAARQSGRGDIPEIVGPLTFEAALSSAAGVATKLCCHPGAAPSLVDGLAAWKHGDIVALLVGPEGGFSPAEIAQAEQQGFVSVRLGGLTLRTELASIACLSMCRGLLDQRRSHGPR